MNDHTSALSSPARAKSRGRRLMGVTAAFLVTCSLVGCDSLLDVDLPGDIPADQISNPDLAVVLGNSVQNAFECFFTNYSGGSGVFTDEYITGSQRAGRERWDDRDVTNTGDDPCRGETWEVEGPGYQALAFGRDVTAQVEDWTDAEVPNRQELLAKVSVYTGYTIELMAEGYCRGVVVEDLGPLLDKAASHTAAEGFFTKALAAASTGSDFANLALVGRARARLNGSDDTGALADAMAVDVGFSFDATFGTVTDRENVQSTENWRDRQYSVDEGLRNLMVGGVADPRVLLKDQGYFGIDGQTAIWSAMKMPNVDSPIRMASWNEAQLIVAEISLGQEAVDRINAVRALYAGLPLFVPADVNDAVEIFEQVMVERQRELVFEGHRLGDFRRHPDWAHDPLAVPLRWQEGLTHLGSTWTPNYCLPFPQSEIDVNPNIT